MLSIAPLAGGPGYYLELANLNYYLEGGEPLPLYHGTAAKELRLSGIAERREVERLCAGYHHERDDLRVKNAGKEDRNPGHDLTFSCPKSVSIAWAMGDPELRKAIEQKQLSAVKQALNYLESKAGFARVAAQGQEVVKVPLLFVLFEHGTSRAMDPQLHTHALCINLTVHGDGRLTAVDTTHLYHLKMAAGAIYRAALARGMQELGFEITQRQIGSSVGFELSCIPKEIAEEFSKRRAEIEAVLKLRAGSLDAADAKYAELVTKETKRTKDTEKPRVELLKEWQEVGRDYGVDAEYLNRQRTPFVKSTPEQRAERKEQIFREAIDALSERHAHWSEADFTKAVAERAAGRISARDTLELVAHKLQSPQLVYLGDLQTEKRDSDRNQFLDKFQSRYSTPEIRALETRMIASVERIIRGPKNESRKDFVEEAIAKRPMFATEDGKEQAEAIRYLTSGPAIRVLSGIAGTGKTTVLHACVEVWKREGREVIGCSFQKVVASRLEKQIGVPCDSVHMTLHRLERGELKLHPKSVILVDESAMLGTKLAARLIEHQRNAPGARLHFIGDGKQLQPVTEGGAHKYLADLPSVGEMRLTKVKRQEEIWARKAVVDMERGAAKEAIKAFIEHGHFHVTDTRPQAMDRIVERWKQDGGIEKPQEVFMITATNFESKQLSLRAQARRILAGVVDPDRKIYGDDVFFHVNDEVRFRKNSRPLGVDNADRGTVTDVRPDKGRMTVKLEKDGREILVDFERYKARNVELAYSSTNFSAQGASLPIVHALMGGSVNDLSTGYVKWTPLSRPPGPDLMLFSRPISPPQGPTGFAPR